MCPRCRASAAGCFVCRHLREASAMARVRDVRSRYESTSLLNGAMKIPDLGCVRAGAGALKVPGSLP